jgi:integrase
MLSRAVDSYLEVRRAAGFQLAVDEGLLRDFVRFATDRGESHIQRQTAIDWAANAPSASQRERRLGMVRRFAEHVRAENPMHDPIPRHVFARKRRRPFPYIFSLAELRRLLEATACLRPRGSLRPATYYTLFGLLAATGLRISEALGLIQDDVTADGLIVRQTKFRKSRMVPLHDSTAAALDSYLDKRRSVGGNDNHVFISTKGCGLTYAMVIGTFCYLLRRIDLHVPPGQRPPRLHHLRHYFAVRALESCASGHDRAARHVLALSTYLGHAHVTDTYWYLQATPVVMTNIADACEALSMERRHD